MPAAAFIGKTNQDLGMPDALCAFWDTRLGLLPLASPVNSVTVQSEDIRHYQARIVPELSASGLVATVM